MPSKFVQISDYKSQEEKLSIHIAVDRIDFFSYQLHEWDKYTGLHEVYFTYYIGFCQELYLTIILLYIQIW
jgi:hypothetical protein